MIRIAPKSYLYIFKVTVYDLNKMEKAHERKQI